MGNALDIRYESASEDDKHYFHALNRACYEEVIERRLENAAGEMALANRYHHVVVNDDLERAATELADLVSEARRAAVAAH